MTFVRIAAMAAWVIVIQRAPAQTPNLPTLDSSGLFEMLGEFGYSPIAAEIGAIWAWEEPAECSRQVAKRFDIPAASVRQICEFPRTVVGETTKATLPFEPPRQEATADPTRGQTFVAPATSVRSQTVTAQSEPVVRTVNTASTYSGTRTIRFLSDSQNAAMEYVDGKAVFTLHADGIIVSASLYDSSKAAIAEVTILNDSPRSFHVLPEAIELYALGTKYQQVARKDPQKMVASIERNARWISALDGALASLAKQQVTATSSTYGNLSIHDMRGNSAYGSYSGSTFTTVTMPDWQARRAAALRTIRRMDEAESKVDFIKRSALKANTIRPREQVAGFVWFDRDSSLRKSETEIILQVLIGGFTFQFPFPSLK